jgi:HSP20 family protein
LQSGVPAGRALVLKSEERPMNDQTALPAEQRRTEGTPLAPLFRLRDEIDRLFDDFPFSLSSRSIFAFPSRAAVIPAMELAETDGGYALSVELPGLEEKDIDVEFADGVLTVSGEKREESEKTESGYLMSERRYGSFRRQLTLPADADPDTIDAQFKRGVLKLAMKKDAKAAGRAKKIKIG